MSREEGTKDMVTGSEHICLPAVHMFTPDPRPVTVWVAPTLLALHYITHTHTRTHTPTKAFLPTVEEILRPEGATVSELHQAQK